MAAQIVKVLRRATLLGEKVQVRQDRSSSDPQATGLLRARRCQAGHGYAAECTIAIPLIPSGEVQQLCSPVRFQVCSARRATWADLPKLMNRIDS